MSTSVSESSASLAFGEGKAGSAAASGAAAKAASSRTRRALPRANLSNAIATLTPRCGLAA